jgi:hypothetical protein
MLEAPVLFFALAQPPQLRDAEPGACPFPTGARLLRDAQLAADFTHRCAGFGLSQSVDHLRCRERLSGHG